MYPRAFDLIHVRELDLPHDTCLIQAILELDRLLRPGGYILISSGGMKGDGQGGITRIADVVTEDFVAVLGWREIKGVDSDIVGEGTLVMRKLGGVFKEI